MGLNDIVQRPLVGAKRPDPLLANVSSGVAANCLHKIPVDSQPISRGPAGGPAKDGNPIASVAGSKVSDIVDCLVCDPVAIQPVVDAIL